MENSVAQLHRGRPGDLLPRLHHGALRGADVPRLRQTALGLEVVREEYPGDDGARHTHLCLRILLPAARLDERLGGNAAVRRSLVLQSELPRDYPRSHRV